MFEKSIVKQILIRISHVIKGMIYTYSWYPRLKMNYNKTAVAVIDGRLYSGGLTDRFIGIVSLYAWAKINKIPFRIQYTDPFNITDYLEPNSYDWIPQDGDYVKSSLTSVVVYAVGELRVNNRLSALIKRKQIHFYGNRDLLLEPKYNHLDWGELYKELFRPTKKLQYKIDNFRNMIGSRHFSIVFRFQNLLGDFEEYDFTSLKDNSEKEDYLKHCINAMLHLLNKENRPCIITSDSITFLHRVKNIPNVYIIPGSIVHMGSNSAGTYHQYEKSFLDFYLLSESIKIYNIVYRDMYPSGFPLYAAKVNSIPFERIII